MKESAGNVRSPMNYITFLLSHTPLVTNLCNSKNCHVFGHVYRVFCEEQVTLWFACTFL
jgi:hypothetical protein